MKGGSVDRARETLECRPIAARDHGVGVQRVPFEFSTAALGGELDADVYGVKVDDVNTQARFVEQQELNFPLLSDPDGSVVRKYGVLSQRMPMARRITFVIDPKGVVRHVETKVQVKLHGQDLVSILKNLQSG